MLHRIIMLGLASAMATLLLPSQVDAWGVQHVGYTHVGPAGVYHTGATVGYGPGGVYGVNRTGASGYGVGGYHYGYGYGVARPAYYYGYNGWYPYTGYPAAYGYTGGEVYGYQYGYAP
jgi:hypothetical protein